jgi:hypothetical protein
MKNIDESNDKRIFIGLFVFGERRGTINFLGVGAQDQAIERIH